MIPDKIRKAVIPAAGFGTRLLPATKALPKEMLTVVNKPVIQYVVEEAAAAGISEILIVISKGKEALHEHFKPHPELQNILQAKGKTEELKSIRLLHEIANISIVYQHEQKGLGDAIACAEQFVGNDAFAVLLGDTIIESAVSLTKQLADVFNETQQSLVALQEVPNHLVHRYGVFVGERVKANLFQATSIVEKPSKAAIPSNLVFAGRYVLTPDIFDALRRTAPGVNNEIQLTDAMRLMMEKQSLLGLLFDGKRYDVGNKLDFIKANVQLGLQHPEIADELNAWLRSLRLR